MKKNILIAILFVVFIFFIVSGYILIKKDYLAPSKEVPVELQNKVIDKLDTKYKEKFKLVNATYNYQSDSYNFTVSTDSMPEKKFTVITDLMGKGSFVSNFLQTRQAIESAKLAESYFKGIVPEGQYKAVFSGGSISTLELPENKKELSDLALHNLHSKAMHLDEWIQTSHEAMKFGGTIKINIKETPENILKVLESTYNLNKYLLSQGFFGYAIGVQLMDLPETPEFVKYPLTSEIFVRQQGWETDKYTWATIDISECQINGIKKQCYHEPNTPEYAYIGQNIKNPLDVAKYLKLIPRHSVKADIFGDEIDSWVIKRRARSPDSKWLIETPMYKKIQKLYKSEQ